MDELGGLDAALEYAAEVSGKSSRSKLKIIELPEPLSPIEQFMNVMSGQVRGGQELAVLETIAPLMKQIETVQRSGPVQTYDPAIMTFRP